MNDGVGNEAGFRSCLYPGRVMHRRLRPLGHRFAYGVLAACFDVDELPRLHRAVPLFSYNRFNLFSFRDRDHGARDGTPPRAWAEAALRRQGIEVEGGRIELVCFPRVLGRVFNPLAVWFCRGRDDALRAVIYEVSNTFGEWHHYVLPVTPEAVGRDGWIAQRAMKRFYVSPFIDMDQRYRFRLRPPDGRLALTIRQDGAEGEEMVASWTGRRRPIDARALARAFLRYPLLALTVPAAIHWQALRLWWKGAPFHAPRRRPRARLGALGNNGETA